MRTSLSPAPAIVFAQHVAGIGQFTLRSLSLPADLDLVAGWLQHEHAHFWGMRHCSRDAIADYLHPRLAGAAARVLLGACEGRPAFLLECYDPADDPIATCYACASGDRGMHFLTAPPAAPVHGFTRAVLYTIQRYLFSEPAARRIVVEPDVRNHKIHRLNRLAGFVYQRQIALPHKRAWLAFCHRQDVIVPPGTTS